MRTLHQNGNGHAFRPLPLLGNAHVQTILGNCWGGPPLTVPVAESAVRLSDGDQMVLHDCQPPAWQEGDRIIVLVHGLGGSHQSSYNQRLTLRLMPQGWRVIRVDLRGAGKGLPLARRGYHGGCSDDIREALAAVHDLSPTSPIDLVGVSLGGNVVLKLAGEVDQWPVPGLARVAALAPPIDLVRCQVALAQPSNRFYELNFLRELMRLVRLREEIFPDDPVVSFPRPMTLKLFDELYTAPRSGFGDAMDYYRRASSLPFMPHIRVPTFVLTAQDDPFIPVEPFQEVQVPDHVHIWIAPAGGHLGFLGRDGAGGIRWAEQRIYEWLMDRPGVLENGACHSN